jgi:hypothetical protein
MEQQRLGGDYMSPQDRGLADPDEDREYDGTGWDLDLCTCGHAREDHMTYREECAKCGCSCFELDLEKFK